MNPTTRRALVTQWTTNTKQQMLGPLESCQGHLKGIYDALEDLVDLSPASVHQPAAEALGNVKEAQMYLADAVENTRGVLQSLQDLMPPDMPTADPPSGH